jgi:hypothetical protein
MPRLFAPDVPWMLPAAGAVGPALLAFSSAAASVAASRCGRAFDGMMWCRALVFGVLALAASLGVGLLTIKLVIRRCPCSASASTSRRIAGGRSRHQSPVISVTAGVGRSGLPRLHAEAGPAAAWLAPA